MRDLREEQVREWQFPPSLQECEKTYDIRELAGTGDIETFGRFVSGYAEPRLFTCCCCCCGLMMRDLREEQVREWQFPPSLQECEKTYDIQELAGIGEIETFGRFVSGYAEPQLFTFCKHLMCFLILVRCRNM